MLSQKVTANMQHACLADVREATIHPSKINASQLGSSHTNFLRVWGRNWAHSCLRVFNYLLSASGKLVLSTSAIAASSLAFSCLLDHHFPTHPARRRQYLLKTGAAVISCLPGSSTMGKQGSVWLCLQLVSAMTGSHRKPMTETMGGFWNQAIRGDACTSVRSSIIAPSWKQSKRPLMAEWTHKLWHIHSTEYYLAIKRNPVPKNAKNIDESWKPTTWKKPDTTGSLL